MHLVNFPEVRIKKYSQGYAVEILQKKWWGKKYWKHIISVSGINNEPWYYESHDIAVYKAQKYFGWELHHGTALYS